MVAGGSQEQASNIVGLVGAAVMGPRSVVGIASRAGPVPREVAAMKEQNSTLSPNSHRGSRHTTTSCAVIVGSGDVGAGDSEGHEACREEPSQKGFNTPFRVSRCGEDATTDWPTEPAGASDRAGDSRPE